MQVKMGATFALGLILLSGPALAAGTSLDVPVAWDRGQITLSSMPNGRLAVDVPGALLASAAGDPDLPWVPVEVVIPAGRLVREWTWRPLVTQELASGVPAATPLDRPSTAGGPLDQPDRSEVYAGTEVYPRQTVRYSGTQSKAGTVLARFLLAPVSWNPVDHTFHLVERGEIHIELADDPAPDRFLGPSLRPKVTGVAHRGTAAARPTDAARRTPSLDDAPASFVIVSPTAFVDSYQPLLDWKNETGTPATLVTVDWIYQNYPHGADGPEKIRLFLQDAYKYWGTETVIMGADPAFVPIRFTHSYAWNAALGGINIATDYYYACLDGSWNSNGNAVFGEAKFPFYMENPDQVDMRHELLVGRIPARSTSELDLYIQKYLKYVTDPVRDDYLRKFTLLGEVLFDADWRLGDCDDCQQCPEGQEHPCAMLDGATECMGVVDSVSQRPNGEFWDFRELYYRSQWWIDHGRTNARFLNQANALLELNAGTNIVFHTGHGTSDRWSIGTDNLVAGNLRGLTNGDRIAGMAYTINCNSAEVVYDCMAEAWIFAPSGGGLDYIGSTNLDFPLTARYLQQRFFARWPGESRAEAPGDAFFEGLDYFSATAEEDGVSVDNQTRFLEYSLIFIGDPAMMIWSAVPGDLEVSNPGDLPLGTDQVQVTVMKGGSPVAGARVTLYKAGDAWGSATTLADGSALVPFEPTSTGAYKLTVTHPDAVPHRSSGQVTAGAAALMTIAETTVNDQSSEVVVGNGNGRIEIGESVALDLSYENRGGSESPGMEVVLRLSSVGGGGSATVLDSVETVGATAAGGSGTAPAAFLLSVGEVGALSVGPIDDLVPIQGSIIWKSGGAEVRRDQVSLYAYRPDVVLYASTLVNETDAGQIPDQGDNVSWSMDFENRGGGDASHVRARIEPYRSDYIIARNLSTGLTPAEAGQHATTLEPFQFTVNTNLSVRFRLFLEDTLSTPPRLLSRRRIDLLAPMPMDSVQAAGSEANVVLKWERVVNPDLWGYRIQRSTNGTDGWTELGTGYVEGYTYYSDDDLPSTTRFFYRVAAVDSSGHLGAYSPVAEGVTAPAALSGWPNYLDESPDKFSSPTVINLDPWYLYETILTGDALYVFEPNGTDYYDGDGVTSTKGKLFDPSEYGKHAWAKPGVADADSNGTMEIFCPVVNDPTNQDPPSRLLCLDGIGKLLWSRDLWSGPTVSSPCIGNIDDNYPGDEVVLLAGSKVFGFHWDGTPVRANSGGVILDLNAAGRNANFLYGSVALADFDRTDDEFEICFTTNDTQDATRAKLWIINKNGTNLQDFPIDYADLIVGATDEKGNASPALADIDGDLDMEVFINTWKRAWCIDPSQPSVPQKLIWARTSMSGGTAVPYGTREPNASSSLGDLDGDTDLEVVYGWAKGRLHVRDARTGEVHPGFGSGASDFKQVGAENSRLGNAVIGNIDGDDNPEIVIGDNKGNVYAFHGDGTPVSGFPFVIGGEEAVGLAIWDIDRDTHPNLIIQGNKITKVVVLDFQGVVFDPAHNPWPMFRHDSKNSGRTDRPVIDPVPVGLQAPLLTAAGGLSVDLRWETESEYTEFLLERRLIDDALWTRVASIDPTEARVAPNTYGWTDEAPGDGVWSYRVIGVLQDGGSEESGQAVISLFAEPLTFRLHPAQPNPFNPITRVQLDLPVAGMVTLRLLDPAGREVRVLLAGRAPAGRHQFLFDGHDDAGRPLGSGVYFLEAQGGSGQRQVEKIVLLK